MAHPPTSAEQGMPRRRISGVASHVFKGNEQFVSALLVGSRVVHVNVAIVGIVFRRLGACTHVLAWRPETEEARLENDEAFSLVENRSPSSPCRLVVFASLL